MSRRLVVILALLFVACGDPPPEKGVVIDKDYEPAHWEGGYRTEYRMEYKCRSESRYDYASKQYKMEQVCGTESVPYDEWDPHHHYERDKWRLKLEECGTGKSKKCHRGWITVSESRYEKYKIGSYYSGELK